MSYILEPILNAYTVLRNLGRYALHEYRFELHNH